ncbi:hypothetical protein FHETE_7736 [Fusarium heterosporum]|uniref:DUF676 domain-containing protein n=1 Tax=Fusarium heterosporum TaxID=42747 RepID=A0A8H5T5Z8_FUSHE|nr:hypothetical protein FHETE_7736 [Fusarium heterosporum]
MSNSRTPRNKPVCYRIENLKFEHRTAEQVKNLFHSDDKPHITVRLVAPSDAGFNNTDYTAIIDFRVEGEPRLDYRGYVLDKTFEGFTTLNVPKQPVAADIIAVTGLAGHAIGSWMNARGESFLLDYLPADLDGRARILTYGYESKLQGSRNISSLLDYSGTFMRRLMNLRKQQRLENRPIILIGHSLGGLIIKQALSDSGPDVVRRLSVRAIMFFGTPHLGLNDDSLETLVRGQPNQHLINDLHPHSSTIASMRSRFEKVSRATKIYAFYETVHTPKVKDVDGKWSRVADEDALWVTKESACLHASDLSEAVQVNADHSQMVKLNRGQSGPYMDLLFFIQASLQTAPEIWTGLDSSDRFAGDYYDIGSHFQHPSPHHLASTAQYSSGTVDDPNMPYLQSRASSVGQESGYYSQFETRGPRTPMPKTWQNQSPAPVTSPLHTTPPATQTPSYGFDGPNRSQIDSLARQSSYLSLSDRFARTHHENSTGFPTHNRETYLRAVVHRLAQAQAPVQDRQDHIRELVGLLCAMDGHERLAEAEGYMLELLRMHEEVFGRASQEVLADTVVLAEIAEKGGKTSQAEKWHRRTIDLATGSFGERSETTLGYNLGLLKFLWRSEQSSEVKSLLRDLLKRMLNVQGPYTQSTVECQLLLAEVLGEEDEWSEAKDLLLKAVSSLETVTGCGKKIHCEALLQLVEAHGELDDYEEAERVARRVLEILQHSQLDDKDVQLQSLRARRLLADSLEDQDLHDQSIRILEQLLDGIDQHDYVDTEKYGLTRPQILLSIGIQQHYESNLDEAGIALDKALKSREYDTLDSNQERFEILYFSAVVLVEKGDFKQAENLVQRSIALAKVDNAELSRINASVLLARVQKGLGQAHLAISTLKTLLSGPQEETKPPDFFAAKDELAKIYLDQNNFGEARSILQALLQSQRSELPSDDSSISNTAELLKIAEEALGNSKLYDGLKDKSSDSTSTIPGRDQATSPKPKTSYTVSDSVRCVKPRKLMGELKDRLYPLSDSDSDSDSDLDLDSVNYSRSATKTVQPYGKSTVGGSGATCDIEGCNCGLPKSKIPKPESTKRSTTSTCDIEGCTCGLPKSRIDKPEPEKATKSTCDIEDCNCGLPKAVIDDKPESAKKATTSTCDIEGCKCGLPRSKIDKPNPTLKAKTQTCDIKGCTCGLPPSSAGQSSQPKTPASKYSPYFPNDSSDSSDDINLATDTTLIEFVSLKPANEALKDVKLSLKCVGIEYTARATDKPGQTYFSGYYHGEMLGLSVFTQTPNEVQFVMNLESDNSVKDFQRDMQLLLAPLLLKKRMASIFILSPWNPQESADIIRDSLLTCDTRIESTEGPPLNRVFHCQLKLKKLLRATAKVDATVSHKELLNDNKKVVVSFMLMDGDPLVFEGAVNRILSSLKEVMDEDVVY